MKANLTVLIVCLLILLYCVYTNSGVHEFILCLAPIEVVIAFVKIQHIMKRTDLPAKRQKLFRVFTSSQVLDGLAISLSSILFYLVKYITSFKYSFCIGPLVLALLIIFFKAILTKREVWFCHPARRRNFWDHISACFQSFPQPADRQYSNENG